jgi:alcohol dehydrogenase class IV
LRRDLREVWGGDGTMTRVPAFSAPLPTRIVFGSGKIAEVGSIAAGYSPRALLVIGGGSLRASGGLSQVEQSLGRAGVEWTTLEGVPAEPPVDTVDAGRQALRAFGAEVVIGVGGGSVLDVAKAVAALAREDASGLAFHRGDAKVTQRGLACIAAPTTSGTGAEVTPNSVLSDRERRVKASLRGGELMPAVALLDPELTLSCPPQVTAHSGLDAICQALESYVSIGANPFSDALALEALRLMAPALLAAVEDGANIAAREAMALGSLLAGLALASARLGLAHGLAHPIGELYHLPHGLVCGQLTPAVIRFNLPAAATKYAIAARAIGIAGCGDDDHAAANELADWVVRLMAQAPFFGAPGHLPLRPEDFDLIAEQALPSGSTKHNPRPPTAEDLRTLLAGLAS